MKTTPDINALPTLISRRDIDALARPCMTDDKEAELYIREAEKCDLLPALGAALYVAIKDAPKDHDTLLNGGIWDDCNGAQYCAGVRTALAYFAYARITRNGGHVASRFGFSEKRDEYANHVELKQRTAEANEAYAIAVEHLQGCLQYIAKSGNYRDCNVGGVRNTFAPKYRVIKT